MQVLSVRFFSFSQNMASNNDATIKIGLFSQRLYIFNAIMKFFLKILLKNSLDITQRWCYTNSYFQALRLERYCNVINTVSKSTHNIAVHFTKKIKNSTILFSTAKRNSNPNIEDTIQKGASWFCHCKRTLGSNEV